MNKGIWRITVPHFCHANAYGTVQICCKCMRANPVAQIFCQLYCLISFCFWQKDKKFLSSPAASRILHTQLFDGNGAVLVVDAGGSMRCAMLGDQLALLGVKNGWAGVIMYGCIRDSGPISGMDLGVFALAMVPMWAPPGGKGVIDVAQETYKGLTIKVTEFYDGTNDNSIMRLDVLFGWAATYAELATKYAL